jgi:23S rRNA U2552 (ribose-2'-O)-methylase RlmE/FtsJ
MYLQGWENDKADAHFKKQRKSADYADERTKKAFFDMMRKIATEMDKKTGALRFQSDEPIRVLDLCMAPGGYTAAMLDRYPNATSKAFTLPEERGGHQVRLDIQQRRRCEISYVDINMLAGDMGLKVEELPADYPDASQFKFEKLLADEDKFDIVFCDGQVLREHQRSEWREPKEAARLILSCSSP